MADAQPQSRDQPSPGLTLSLSSNNPFRNRAGSPLPKSPASPFDDPTPQTQSRPLSNNPFLDQTTTVNTSTAEPPPLITMADEKDTTTSAAKLLEGLSLGEEKKDKPPRPPMGRPGPPRGDGRRPPGPPGDRRRPPPPGHPGHRPMNSSGSRPRPSGSGNPNSPPRRMASSAGRPRKPETEEERARRKEKERERREKKSTNPHKDLIDKLDETNPFGSSIHHAGPYDAVIPSRNSAKNTKAPMNAFAKDSANMSIGGSGPLNARADHSTFMGKATDEAFNDYSTGATAAMPTKRDLAMFDPHKRVSVIYGDESVGLGTTTFLEGTPAAKSAVEKAAQENAMMNQDGGLQRKKSLAQRIRGMNRPQRDFGPSGRMTNPEGIYRERGSSGSMSSPRGEANPFFSEYDSNKGAEEQISVRKMSSGSPTSPALPGGLERRATADGLGGFEQPKPKTGGGLLGRMKSLKGGPRSRPMDKDLGNAA